MLNADDDQLGGADMVGHFEHVFSEALGGKTVAGVFRPTVTTQIGQDQS